MQKAPPPGAADCIYTFEGEGDTSIHQSLGILKCQSYANVRREIWQPSDVIISY